MAAKDKTRLSAIKSEVGQLHPLLNKLIPKLPDIVDVEYTHGQGEMGADFVMSKRHEIFDTFDYIGVVSKIGRVVQDYSDIERQIDECSVPRTFFGGKDKIRINEIWVVVTEHITKGAQEKIHDKFKNRKIYFIDGARLEKLIDKHIPNYWIDVTLEVGEYLAQARDRNYQLDRALSLIQVSDKWFYIEQDLYDFPRLEYRIRAHKMQQPASRVEIVNEIQNNNILLVEGGMGAGKSKLIRKIVEHYSDPNVYIDSHVLPIPITYKDYIDKYNSSIAKILEECLDDNLRNELGENVKYLILIDGFDEKNLTPEEQVNKLSDIVTALNSYNNVKAVITSRYIKGIDQSNALERELTRYELRPLTFKKMITFLTSLCSQLNLTSRIVDDLQRSPLFKELPKSPIAAILLAKLLNENQQDIPSNMTELYAKYLELMLGRWDIDKGLQSQKEYQALDNIMMNLSRYMLANEIPALSIDEAKLHFTSYLKGRNLGIDADVLFSKMAQRCEMVVVDGDFNTFAFKHRTFPEFFYAKSFTITRDIVLDERVFHPYWMNSYFFYIGILKDCPEVIKSIIDIPVQGEGKNLVKSINLSNFLLAAYATPYDVICNGITHALIESAKLYNDIISGKYPSSVFAKLPRMHLLYIMQRLMRDSYSFDFFKQALEHAALMIDSAELNDEIKCYALFFLNVAYIDLGAGESFDFLLKNHQDKLPIDLVMAYRHESKNIKTHSDIMKKQDKRIKKLFKQNKPLADYVKKMYDMPLLTSKTSPIRVETN